MPTETPSNPSAQDEKQHEAPAIEEICEDETKMSVNHSEPRESEASPIPTIPGEADAREDLIEEGDGRPKEATITDEDSDDVLDSSPGRSSTTLNFNIDGKDFQMIFIYSFFFVRSKPRW